MQEGPYFNERQTFIAQLLAGNDFDRPELTPYMLVQGTNGDEIIGVLNQMLAHAQDLNEKQIILENAGKVLSSAIGMDRGFTVFSGIDNPDSAVYQALRDSTQDIQNAQNFHQSIQAAVQQAQTQRAYAQAHQQPAPSPEPYDLSGYLNQGLAKRKISADEFDGLARLMASDFRAQQNSALANLTVSDALFMHKIDPKYAENRPGMIASSERLNDLSNFIKSDILNAQSPEHLQNKFAFYARVAVHAARTDDLQTMMTVNGALESSVISRLFNEQFPASVAADMDVVRGITRSRNYGAFRAAMGDSSDYIPFDGVLRQDMTFTSENNADVVDGKINIEKAIKVAETMQQLLSQANRAASEPTPVLQTNLPQKINTTVRLEENEDIEVDPMLARSKEIKSKPSDAINKKAFKKEVVSSPARLQAASSSSSSAPPKPYRSEDAAPGRKRGYSMRERVASIFHKKKEQTIAVRLPEMQSSSSVQPALVQPNSSV